MRYIKSFVVAVLILTTSCTNNLDVVEQPLDAVQQGERFVEEVTQNVLPEIDCADMLIASAHDLCNGATLTIAHPWIPAKIFQELENRYGKASPYPGPRSRTLRSEDGSFFLKPIVIQDGPAELVENANALREHSQIGHLIPWHELTDVTFDEPKPSGSGHWQSQFVKIETIEGQTLSDVIKSGDYDQANRSIEGLNRLLTGSMYAARQDGFVVNDEVKYFKPYDFNPDNIIVKDGEVVGVIDLDSRLFSDTPTWGHTRKTDWSLWGEDSLLTLALVRTINRAGYRKDQRAQLIELTGHNWGWNLTESQIDDLADELDVELD